MDNYMKSITGALEGDWRLEGVKKCFEFFRPSTPTETHTECSVYWKCPCCSLKNRHVRCKHQLQLEYLTSLVIIILNHFKCLEDQSESENIILKNVISKIGYDNKNVGY